MDLVSLFPDARATRKLLHPTDVGAVDGCAIVGEESCEGSADDFAAVDDEDSVAEETVSLGEVRGVDVQVFEDFYQGEGCAGEDGLEGVGGWVEVADVLVHVAEVEVGEAFDVFGWRDEVCEVAVLAGGVDWVVDLDAVGGREGVVC